MRESLIRGPSLISKIVSEMVASDFAGMVLTCTTNNGIRFQVSGIMSGVLPCSLCCPVHSILTVLNILFAATIA